MRNQILFLTLTAMCIVFNACSLDPKGDGEGFGIKVIMEGIVPATEDLAILAVPSPTPASLTSFQCFAANVTGAGVPADNHSLNNCTHNDNMNGKGIGIISKPVSRGTPITIQNVPSGTGRNIDVYGVYPSVSECGGTVYSGWVIGAYYLGGTSVDLSDNATVTIAAAFTPGHAESFSCIENNNSTWANLSASPGSYGFGSVTYPSTSASLIITLANNGNYASTMSSQNFSPATHFGFVGGSFPGTGGTCVTSLNTGASCTVTVKFTPSSPSLGAVSSTLTFSYDRGDGNTQAVSVSLTGTGT